jgi:hypothetical protein
MKRVTAHWHKRIKGTHDVLYFTAYFCNSLGCTLTLFGYGFTLAFRLRVLDHEMP